MATFAAELCDEYEARGGPQRIEGTTEAALVNVGISLAISLLFTDYLAKSVFSST